jgi:hypothetical protein
MAVPPLITQDHLEKRIGPVRLAQLTGVMANAQADPTRVADIIQIGSDHVAGELLPGFTTEQIQELLAADSSLQADLAWICIARAAEGKSEFYQDGKFLFDGPFTRALKRFQAIGASNKRSAAEQQVGSNSMLEARVGTYDPNCPPRRFTFLGHRGGF